MDGQEEVSPTSLLDNVNSSTPTSNKPNKKHIVSLGSSFASGASIPPLVHKEANRSSKNYPNLVSRRLDARLTDLSASGATLLHVLDQPQQLMTTTLPPQVSQIPEDADIITLTAGGNDIGYSAHMIADAARADPDDMSWFLDFLSPQLSIAIDPEHLATRFVAVIDAARLRASRAKIFLVEYLPVFGDHAVASSPSVPFAEDRLKYHKSMAEKLRGAYVEAIRQRPDTVLVEVVRNGMAHGVDAPEPWVTGWSADMIMKGLTPYHPNARGHEMVAEMVLESIAKNE